MLLNIITMAITRLHKLATFTRKPLKIVLAAHLQSGSWRIFEDTQRIPTVTMVKNLWILGVPYQTDPGIFIVHAVCLDTLFVLFQVDDSGMSPGKWCACTWQDACSSRTSTKLGYPKSKHGFPHEKIVKNIKDNLKIKEF